MPGGSACMMLLTNPGIDYAALQGTLGDVCALIKIKCKAAGCWRHLCKVQSTPALTGECVTRWTSAAMPNIIVESFSILIDIKPLTKLARAGAVLDNRYVKPVSPGTRVQVIGLPSKR